MAGTGAGPENGAVLISESQSFRILGISWPGKDCREALQAPYTVKLLLSIH